MKLSHRIAQIDYAKAIGIILVVAGHVIIQEEKASPYDTWTIVFIYSFHMPLFFFITGMELGCKSALEPFRTMCAKAARRLLIPYYFWSAAYILLNITFHMSNWKSILLERSYATLTGRGIAPLWFLFALFLCRMAAYPVFQSFGKTRRFAKGCALLAISGCLSVVIHVVFQRFPVENNLILYPLITICRLTPSVFFMSMGYTVGSALLSAGGGHLSVPQRISLLVAGFGALCVLLSHNSVNMHLFHFLSMPLFLLTGALGSCALILLCGLFPQKIPLLSSIGKRSLDIMALHYPPIHTIKAVKILFRCFGINPPTILTTAATVAFTYFLSVALLEPARKKLSRFYGPF